MPSLNQPESRLPSGLEDGSEHDFDGSRAATDGVGALTARRSDPSQRGGFGALVEQPARTAATASATMRSAAIKLAWRVRAGVRARTARGMFMGVYRLIVGKVSGADWLLTELPGRTRLAIQRAGAAAIDAPVRIATTSRRRLR